ncbi:ComF family protein [bacterium]|nr:ComF family protein [bacterium]
MRRLTFRFMQNIPWASLRRKPFSFLRAALDFIYPPACPACSSVMEGDAVLCTACTARLMYSGGSVRQDTPPEFAHLPGALHFDFILTAWDYSEELEKLIHRVKYERGLRLGEHLGCMMARVMNSSRPPADPGCFLSPVPLHRIRQRERGYNQSEILCRGLSRVWGMPVFGDILMRTRNTKSQTRMSAEQRQDNVRGVFRVLRPEAVSGKCILLVDDVITTGATVNGCAAALKEAGAGIVIGLALARPQVFQRIGEP